MRKKNLKTLPPVSEAQNTHLKRVESTLLLVLIGFIVLTQSDGLASNLETFGESLDSVKTLFTGKAWGTGMACATVIGMVVAAAKVSPSAALGVMGIGIGATVYIKWLLG